MQSDIKKKFFLQKYKTPKAVCTQDIVTILNWFSQFLEERGVGNVDFYLLRLVC